MPHCAPLDTRAFQSSKIYPPNSIVDLCAVIEGGRRITSQTAQFKFKPNCFNHTFKNTKYAKDNL